MKFLVGILLLVGLARCEKERTPAELKARDALIEKCAKECSPYQVDRAWTLTRSDCRCMDTKVEGSN